MLAGGRAAGQVEAMTRKPDGPLRTGFTTGACATAASACAAGRLLTGEWTDPVSILLPGGGRARFDVAEWSDGPGWAAAAVVKDAGDDPDVTHGARIVSTVGRGEPGTGVTFAAGEGVGTVTRPGLPIPPGEPAINPVPRDMMTKAVTAVAVAAGAPADLRVEISVPGGREIATRTWNPRLGIVGGLSILGTTGIVRPYSCAAWIASIHRGVDVARANGIAHVCGSTGATSEAAAKAELELPDIAMLDMGDFAGGMLKYLARHPVPRLTIAGGIGKLTKLAQGAVDLHSDRSRVDFAALASLLGDPEVETANTALEALQRHGAPMARLIADQARRSALAVLGGAPVEVDVMVVGRQGDVMARSGF